MKLSAWGNFPVIEGDLKRPRSADAIAREIKNGFKGIPQGMARSYGDSALASQVMSTRQLNHFISLDEETGILHCESGVTLDEILLVIIPKGWMLTVVPGTKMISVGGAIASDVHGKNHHSKGAFSEYVIEFTLINASGEPVKCSKSENTDLFKATCGGMGLTGIITDVKIQLHKTQSAFFELTKYKSRHLEETFALIEDNIAIPYSAAWMDSIASGSQFGRAVVEISTPLADGDLSTHSAPKLAIPFSFPSMAMNKTTMSLLCNLYYHIANTKDVNVQRAHYSAIFNVLDAIKDWNRAYGKQGFVQYQFVLPKSAGIDSFAKVLKEITLSGKASFISVLKLCGESNDNLLSFPMEGYSLALDFKMEPGVFAFLERLDDIVLDFGGRVYLTKDARLSEAKFKRMYPQWETFAQLRAKHGADKAFNSAQSLRLGL
jgi:FAD/FMN-containing dehydrogenase